MDCLGFLAGSCTVHYDGEPERRPSYHSLIQQSNLSAGYALEDGVALHFVGDNVAQIVTSRQQARAFYVSCKDGAVAEQSLQTRYLQ
jgi:peptidase E